MTRKIAELPLKAHCKPFCTLYLAPAWLSLSPFTVAALVSNFKKMMQCTEQLAKRIIPWTKYLQITKIIENQCYERRASNQLGPSVFFAAITVTVAIYILQPNVQINSTQYSCILQKQPRDTSY